MKLLHLKLQGRYKGLKDQSFDFTYCTDNIIALIGLNGSGKSQLLELICETFAYLERAQRDDFKVRKSLPFEVTIQYQFDTAPDKQQIYQIKIDQGGEISSQNLIAGTYYEKPLKEVFLPDHIIGYSSGLNENLQRSFMKNSLQYYEVMRIRSNYRKRRAAAIHEEDIFRLNKYYSQRYSGIYQVDQSYHNNLLESDTNLPSTIFLDYDCNSLLMASLAILPNNEIDNLLRPPDLRD